MPRYDELAIQTRDKLLRELRGLGFQPNKSDAITVKLNVGDARELTAILAQEWERRHGNDRR